MTSDRVLLEETRPVTVATEDPGTGRGPGTERTAAKIGEGRDDKIEARDEADRGLPNAVVTAGGRVKLPLN